MKTLLFVATEPSLTGAPVYLLNHVKQIRKNTKYECIIIFIYKKGNYVEEFQQVAKVYFWEDILCCGLNKIPFVKSAYKKLLDKKWITGMLMFLLFYYKNLRNRNIFLVIANSSSIDTESLIFFKKATLAPVITIVHEGEKLLQMHNKLGIVEKNLSNSDQIIVVSEYLKKVLINLFPTKKKITVITGSINYQKVLSKPEVFLKVYNIPEHAQVVMSSGWLSWHKGADFFIQAAIQVLKVHPETHFCWLGDAAVKEDLEQFNYDIRKAGIQNQVHHIPSTTTPLDFYDRANVFLMLSRNESFSLVTVEACSLKKPVLCFNNSGGPCEILDNNPDLMVPYGDIELLSQKISKLLTNSELRNEIGEMLYERVNANYSLEKTSVQLLEIIVEADLKHSKKGVDFKY